MSRRVVGALVALGIVLGGCGLKGPLYLPEKSGDVTIRPAPASTPPAAPAEPAAPQAPAEPEQPQDPPTGRDSG